MSIKVDQTKPLVSVRVDFRDGSWDTFQVNGDWDFRAVGNEVIVIFDRVYGDEVRRWYRRWGDQPSDIREIVTDLIPNPALQPPAQPSPAAYDLNGRLPPLTAEQVEQIVRIAGIAQEDREKANGAEPSTH